jgi:predicted membrane-bound spermidine synthase
MNKAKVLEVSLVLSTALAILYWYTSIKIYLYLAIAIGLVGILIPPLANLIAKGWFKLADLLSFVMSRIILGTLFFLVLFPISLLYRIGRTDKLQIRKSETTTWVTRNHQYMENDLENIW